MIPFLVVRGTSSFTPSHFIVLNGSSGAKSRMSDEPSASGPFGGDRGWAFVWTGRAASGAFSIGEPV